MKGDRAAARFVKTHLVRLSVAAGRVSRRSLINLREHAQVGHNKLLHATNICSSKSQQNVVNNCINIYEYFQSFLTAFKILQYFFPRFLEFFFVSSQLWPKGKLVNYGCTLTQRYCFFCE